MNLAPFNSIPNLMGFLVIADDGAVIASNGELENDEKTSDIVYKLVTMTQSIDKSVFVRNSLQKITIAYDDFSYVICLSNRKIYVAKKKLMKS